MATLYPSLEDMKGHQLLEGAGAEGLCPAAVPALYPDLAALDDYMGLALSSADVQRSLVPAVGIGPRGGVPWPRRLVTPWPAPPQAPGAAVPGQLVAPLSGGDAGLRRAAIKPGLREIHLCKDERGKTGLKLKNIDQGIFVQLVKANSPAALVGLRFGDQVLQLDGRSCAGWSSDKAQRALRKASPEKIVMVVRDRPFQRTVTVHKDSNGHVGFVAKKGQIVSLTKDGSAARNGLLTHHYICEVNGQNVIGLKDKQLQEVLAGAGRIVTLTIIPARKKSDRSAEQLRKAPAGGRAAREVYPSRGAALLGARAAGARPPQRRTARGGGRYNQRSGRRGRRARGAQGCAPPAGPTERQLMRRMECRATVQQPRSSELML
uniref:Syndecan binding protein 2 n=1 Tax=Nothoprocta perdicaria TaxID=30464 RepID=A0A8C6ZDM1_NOTPE